ncbi:MAG TPA: hypothetical protein VHN37_06850 [Actinomycetota bacterium]|nr:hypothetical protein [Actinomycetota bacterium]
MEAQITGLQRKVMGSSVRPVKVSHGEAGIAVRGGKTLPFRVARSWSAPAGVYPEQWFLVRPDTREVLHEGPSVERPIWGLQGLTEVVDEVVEPLPLDPGSYLVVFSLGGHMGGQAEVEAFEAASSS